MMRGVQEQESALNAICPYFTMFPLAFPRQVLSRHSRFGQRVLDPFCGRGTTNFAARLAGLDSLGVDSNPVAVAITAAKLAKTDVRSVIRSAQRILSAKRNVSLPKGDFWELAYQATVLNAICQLRAGLLEDCRSNARLVLRGIILGALHGPLAKYSPGYFSNQSTRTYAPKPGYAVRYWKAHKMAPPKVDVLDVIRRRAERFLSGNLPNCDSVSRLGDSRDQGVIARSDERVFDWVITSPPYYGMRTYIQDQWLRNWFLGGPDKLNYATDGQLDHGDPEHFGAQLTQVWNNAAAACREDARMVIRFGGIRDRKADPLEIIKTSVRNSVWRVTTIHDAGSANTGKRQADSFLRVRSEPLKEFDIWACVS